MKRVFDPHEPEAMDRAQSITPHLEEALRHLVTVNRALGSHRLIRGFLRQWLTPGRSYRVLDLCTGVGDIPRLMVDWARRRGIVLKVDAVDANDSTLEVAKRSSRDYPEIHFLRSDAAVYETAETYDLVTCSLALHHFTEERAATLLRQCQNLSHRFVLVTDLERGLLTSFGAQVLATLYAFSPMTREDALASARSAFSFHEFRALAETAGWRDFGHARFLICRQAIWLDGHDAGDIPIGDAAVGHGLPCPT